MQDDEIQQLVPKTPDFKTELAEKLSQLAPEAIADGKVDTKKLQELLQDDAADETERFGLFWPGKKRAMRAAQEPTTATLKPEPDLSKDWDTTQNIFIEGDNLEVLKVLQKSYHNKIKMIYIDPPYNTGKDFVYPDNYQEGLKSYLEFTKQVDEGGKKISTNTDAAGRYHSNWLNMMYPRLKLARNLLTDDGVIFISIDDNEQSNLKKLCDEIFGENNFVGQIVRNTNSSKNQSLFLSVSHEYCLVYAKNIEILSQKHADNKWAVPKNNIDEYKKRVAKLKSEGLSNDEITEELKNLTNYPRFIDFTNYWYFDDRGLYRKGDLGGVKNGNVEPLFNPLTNNNDPVPPGGYRYSKDKLTALISENRIHFHEDGSLPTIKRYLEENSTQRPKSIMSDDQRPDYAMLRKWGIYFDNPKQLSFMKRIISIMDDDAVVLDFFSGSATTGHAVMELNAESGTKRTHIQVQLPEPLEETSEAFKAGYRNISELSRTRLDKSGNQLKESTDFDGDIGFRTYRLIDSNFSKWDGGGIDNKEALQQSLNLVRESSDDSATEQDLLTEIVLRLGLEPTAKIRHSNIDGLSVWDIEEGTVVAYLNEHQKPVLDQLRSVVALEPAKLVVIEDSFKGDDQLKTNLVQDCKSKNIDLWTV
jgi:adenine-specific DNA-methyltransferase